MVRVPRSCSSEQLLSIVYDWLDVLAKEDYDAVAAALGYLLAYGQPPAECIRDEICRYRSPEFFPGIEDFKVSDWRSACGGNPSPKKLVRWYKPTEALPIVAVVNIDLPLNGRWSDLEADFVFFLSEESEDVLVMRLEEIGSYKQYQREMKEAEKE
jgi:hypothetical protein